jgi:dipeptidyl-peptidase-4
MIAPLLLLALAAAGDAPAEPFLARYAATRAFSAGRPARAALTSGAEAAVFLRSGPRSAEQALYVTDLASGETRQLASAASLLAGGPGALTAAEQAQLERQRVYARGITAFDLSRDGARLLVTVGGRLFLLERATGKVTPLAPSGRPLDARFSPDGRSLSYVVEGDLRVMDLATGTERRLTEGATETLSHGLAEFAAQEELGRQEGHWWSPDSRLLAYQETDESAVERFTIHDPLHPEKPADTFRYPRAGRENARVRVGVVPAAGGATTWLDWDRARWPYLAAVAWDQGGPLSLVVLDRRQRSQALLAADPATGGTRLLVEERDEAWVNHLEGFPLWREDGKGFFWRTERNGGPEIELRRPDGGRVATWVAPAHGLATLVGFDHSRRWLWFTGGADPAEARLFVVRNGRAPVEVGPAAGPVWTRADLARRGGALVVTRATFEAVGDVEVWRPDGTRLATLPSVAEAPPFGLNAELRWAGPSPGLRALVVRPRGASPGARLPVLVDVYGGPHAQVARVGPDPLTQWIADQGWVVVQVDGRGTPRRGRAFERAIQGDLVGPALEDQVAALRALGAELPELDLDRVGIFGWSFGGTMAAAAVLRHPELFKAAVAGAPVAEWRDYDTAYTERYLGLPAEDPAAYDRSSLLADAPRLTRPLLLVHGTADDNVYFFHSLKLGDALLRSGRPYDLLVLPGLTHLALRTAEPAVVERIWERMLGYLAAAVATPGPSAGAGGAAGPASSAP